MARNLHTQIRFFLFEFRVIIFVSNVGYGIPNFWQLKSQVELQALINKLMKMKLIKLKYACVRKNVILDRMDAILGKVDSILGTPYMKAKLLIKRIKLNCNSMTRRFIVKINILRYKLF